MSEPTKTPEVPPKSSAAATTIPDAYKEGAARIRTTATWLVTTFGALGAALVGTLSIASLAGHSLEDSQQAIAGFLLAIAGCVVAILAAAYTLTTVKTNLRSLAHPSWTEKPMRAYATRLDNLTAGFGGLDNLLSLHQGALKDGDRAYLQDKPHEVEEARRTLALTQLRVNTLLNQTAFEALRRRFRVTVAGVSVGVVLAAVGAVLFATGVPSEEEEADLAVPDRPAYAAMQVSEEARGKYSEILGSSCDLSGVLVVVTASDSTTFDITASETADDCALASFEASSKEVTLTSCRSALEAPQPETSPSPSAATSAALKLAPEPADPPPVCRPLDYDGDEIPLRATQD